MAGHNKWKQIKHKKDATDKKRSKLFSMLSKQITVQSKLAGGDLNNPSLKAAILRAREYSMPNDNIDKAVKKGVGGEGGTLTEVTFEAYGPGGVAIIVEAITDNNNRTSQELRFLINENGGNFGTPGSASWAFSKSRNEQGEIVWTPNATIPLSETDDEALSTLLDKIDDHDDVRELFTNAE